MDLARALLQANVQGSCICLLAMQQLSLAKQKGWVAVGDPRNADQFCVQKVNERKAYKTELNRREMHQVFLRSKRQVQPHITEISVLPHVHRKERASNMQSQTYKRIEHLIKVAP